MPKKELTLLDGHFAPCKVPFWSCTVGALCAKTVAVVARTSKEVVVFMLGEVLELPRIARRQPTVPARALLFFG